MVNNENNAGDRRRDDFLFHMYNQMFNDINRHINIIWQPITVLVGSLGLIAIGVKDIIPIDLAITLIILLVGWLIANIYDSAYWYNRNLVIIANIERQFLLTSDQWNICYYFGSHRKKGSMLTHIKIQWVLGIFIGVVILIYHIFTEILNMFPFYSDSPTDFRLEVILPYVVAIALFIWLRKIKENRDKSYLEFLENSPGIDVDTTGIKYGVGHPVEQDKGGLPKRS